jgi:hypothetical protein
MVASSAHCLAPGATAVTAVLKLSPISVDVADVDSRGRQTKSNEKHEQCHDHDYRALVVPTNTSQPAHRITAGWVKVLELHMILLYAIVIVTRARLVEFTQTARLIMTAPAEFTTSTLTLGALTWNAGLFNAPTARAMTWMELTPARVPMATIRAPSRAAWLR